MNFLISSSVVFVGRFPIKSFTLDVLSGELKVSETDSKAQSESVSQLVLSYKRQVIIVISIRNISHNNYRYNIFYYIVQQARL